MHASWLDKLRDGRTLVIDGGTGSELHRRGVALDRHAWSGAAALTHFDVLTAIHADYLRAGAEVLTTNTFGTSRFVLRAAGLEERFAQINRAAVDAVLRARDSTGLHADIAGCISCLPPAFDVGAYPSARAELDAYVELAETLAEGGADLLVLEMMEETEHAPRACEAARRVGLPFWLGLSCRLGADGHSLVAYDFPQLPFGSLLDELLDFDPVVVNVMHSPADAIVPALSEIERRWRGYRGAYPTELATLSPAALAALADDWSTAHGARVVGGCCDTTPSHIRAIAAALRRAK